VWIAVNHSDITDMPIAMEVSAESVQVVQEVHGVQGAQVVQVVQEVQGVQVYKSNDET